MGERKNNCENSADFLQGTWNAKRELLSIRRSNISRNAEPRREYKCFLANDIPNVTGFHLNNFPGKKLRRATPTRRFSNESSERMMINKKLADAFQRYSSTRRLGRVDCRRDKRFALN